MQFYIQIVSVETIDHGSAWEELLTNWHKYINTSQAERNLIKKTLGKIFTDVLKNKKYCGVNKVGEKVAIS